MCGSYALRFTRPRWSGSRVSRISPGFTSTELTHRGGSEQAQAARAAGEALAIPSSATQKPSAKCMHIKRRKTPRNRWPTLGPRRTCQPWAVFSSKGSSKTVMVELRGLEPPPFPAETAREMGLCGARCCCACRCCPGDIRRCVTRRNIAGHVQTNSRSLAPRRPGRTRTWAMRALSPRIICVRRASTINRRPVAKAAQPMWACAAHS
jgi:hypothetical protein